MTFEILNFSVFLLLCLGVGNGGLLDLLHFTADDPDISRNFTQMISSKGYPVINYQVKTEDGYLLTLTRIPHGRFNSASPGRRVALLQHGLMATPDQWVANSPEQSLAYILADAGYDVWMGCSRGCPYSLKHQTLSTNSAAFWDFSWEEVGTKDYPAFVDFILKETGQDKLYLIGHSMGTTSSFIFLSTKPEYNSKIRALLALAPVANLTHTQGMSKYFIPWGIGFDKFVQVTSKGQLTWTPEMKRFFEIMCGSQLAMAINCDLTVFINIGMEGSQQFNQSRFPVYIEHVLGGASTKQIAHYSQCAVQKRFARYDYGTTENMKRYGQSTPPRYPLEKITAPTGLFYGRDDMFGDPDDMTSLRSRLHNVVEVFTPSVRPWSHMDFWMAIDAKKYLYDRMMTVMNKY